MEEIEITKIEDKPHLIGEIDFLDVKVKVYHDPTSVDENSLTCSWQARNPDSFYQGIIWMDKETGKCTYPEDAVIPEQTERDREIIPKFIVTAYKEINSKLIDGINKYLNSDFNRRNRI